MKNLILTLLCCALSACASVPMHSLEDDEKAKRFDTPVNKSRLYVYRNEIFGSAVKIKLTLDGVSMGETAHHVFHMWDVDPGNHRIGCEGESDDELSINTESGKTYFIWQEMKMGFLWAGCKLHIVTEQRGVADLRDCHLAKSGPADEL